MATLQSYFDAVIYFAPFGSPWPDKVGGKNKPQEYFQASTGKSKTTHPCARPYRCVKSILCHWFKEGEYIVDPFAGSDTMGFACRELNLKWDSCEIDPDMYETGNERHRQGVFGFGGING
jgi:DNA modification methylase